jgi:hypothetical protein
VSATSVAPCTASVSAAEGETGRIGSAYTVGDLGHFYRERAVGVENRSIFRQSLCVKELPVIYGEQAAAFMEFVSAEYEARDWTPG